MKKLIIDRTKWNRGECFGSSALRRANGSMCCLGFFALSCGCTEDQITDVGYPEPRRTPEMPIWSFNESGADGRTLAIVNDAKVSFTQPCYIADAGSPIVDEAGREQYIKKKFAEHGVEVEFK